MRQFIDQRIFNTPRANGVFYPATGTPKYGTQDSEIRPFLHGIPIEHNIPLKPNPLKEQRPEYLSHKGLPPLDFFSGSKRFFLPWHKTWCKSTTPKEKKFDNLYNGGLSSLYFLRSNRGKRSVKGFRDHGSLNVPRPNGFFFPSEGKISFSVNKLGISDWTFSLLPDRKKSKEPMLPKSEKSNIPEHDLEELVALYQILTSDEEKKFEDDPERRWPYINLRFS